MHSRLRKRWRWRWAKPTPRIEALNKAVAVADEKTAAFVQAMSDDAVKVAGDKVFVVRDGKGTDPVTGAEVAVPETAEDVTNNNRMRGELDTALAAHQTVFQRRQGACGGRQDAAGRVRRSQAAADRQGHRR